jgi:hypothetical protein
MVYSMLHSLTNTVTQTYRHRVAARKLSLPGFRMGKIGASLQAYGKEFSDQL